MPEYFVRTNTDRVICVEADSYCNTGSFIDFKKDGKGVASFNHHSILAIIDEEVYQGEFSAINDGDNNEDLIDSDEFVEAVMDIIDVWHEPDEDTPPEVESPDPYPVEHWKNEKTGDEYWGFQTEKGFVRFPAEGYAEEYRQDVIDDLDGDWSYQDPTGYTKVED